MKRQLTCLALIFAVGTSACVTRDATTDQEEVSGATVGAVAGAVAGAVLGNQVKGDKKTRQNARIAGAAAGAAIGGGIGNYMDKQEEKLRQKLRASGVSVTRKGDQIVLNMPGNITFETAKSNINPGFQGVLDGVAEVLKEYKDTSIEISGHTDSRGKMEANQVLSKQRADSVAQFLRQKGVAANRITTVGYGPSQPIADNATEEGRAQNRRVEILLTPKGK
jgi:outer membrane protein OmpA-like peptidoglycan-associated protein